MPAISPPKVKKRVSTSQALARDRLGAPEIGGAIASCVAPLTVAALVFPTALAVTGLIGLSIAIAAVAAILMIFSVGYMAMARHIDNAGAFYAYVAQGIGRPVGVGTSWFALAVYNSFQLCCYGGFGAIASPLVKAWTGVDVPWYVFAFITWTLVGFLGAFEVKVSGRVLMYLAIGETTLVVAFAISIMLTPGFAFNFGALSPSNLWAPSAGTLLVLGTTAFAGIEQSVVYTEESKNRTRTIPRATYGTIVVVASVYMFAALVVVSAGGTQIIERARTEGSDLFFNQATVVLGSAALTGGKVVLLCSLFAALLAFHQAIARYLFALGREGVLPRLLGNTVGGAPRNASFTQTGLALAVLLTYAFADWDPLIQLFYWGSTTGGLGILLLVTLASLAVIAFFIRDKRGENVWRRFIAPFIAAAILLPVSFQAIRSLPVQYDVAPGTGPAKIVPILLAAIFIAGTCWGQILKYAKPNIYQGIGRGTRSKAAGASGLSAVL